MKFLAGLLKTLSILLLLVGTITCTAIIAIVGIVDKQYDVIIVMAAIWLCVLFVFFGIMGTGIALTQVTRLKKRVEHLEQQLLYAPVVPRTIPEAAAVPTAPVQNEPVSADEPPLPSPDAFFDAPPAAPVKKRKVWIPIVIAALVVLAGALILPRVLKGNTVTSEAPEASAESTMAPIQETEAPAVECPITVNGFFVDDSYEDKDGAPLKLVYMFYTMTAHDSNLKIDSKYTKMYIGDNMYESDHFSDVAAACDYTRNYRYTSYIQDVYVGDSVNMVATFYIPEGDLAGGKTVTLEDSQIPGAETLSFSTDEFQHFGAPEEIAMCIDPAGYEETMYLWEDADSSRTQEIRSHLNGYTWNFYVNNMAYELEFWANNNFRLKTAFSNQTGTYTVQNGYVFCTYPDSGYTVKIPYELNNGEFDLDTIKGFDVMSN